MNKAVKSAIAQRKALSKRLREIEVRMFHPSYRDEPGAYNDYPEYDNLSFEQLNGERVKVCGEMNELATLEVITAEQSNN